MTDRRSREAPAAADDEQPSVADRLFAAILAPIAFNISIIIILAVFFRRSRFVGRVLVNHAHFASSLMWVALLVLPALAGFFIGTSRFATLLGHFFYTHMDHEKDARITLAAWSCLFLAAYLITRAMN